MGLIYSTAYQVPFYQSDAARRMTVPAILSVALQISGEQSMALDCSEEWLRETYGLAWIVTEYALEIHRLPRFLEKISIETEAVSYNKLFCYRDFRFISADKKEVLLVIHSTWVLMAIKSRKVARIPEEVPVPYQAVYESKMKQGHNFMPQLTEALSQTYRVRFSDIDINQHVNNSKYYDWAVDLLDFGFQISHEPSEIFIKYKHEVMPDSEVISHMQLENLVSHHQINQQDCEIEIVWKEVAIQA
jgi:medium-chain acyl-[acyl-carrier-protein] hydrolase